MWTGKSELTFSPVSALMPATAYKALLNNNLLKYSATKFNVDDDPLLFHTPFLKINTINTYWSLSEELASQVEVRCQVMFNNPVTPSKLKPLLKLLVGGKATDYRIVTQNDAETIEIAFPYDVQNPDTEAKGEIIIEKGLTCSGGNTATVGQVRSDFVVPSKDKLTIQGFEPGFEKGNGYIDIFTSQPLPGEGLAGFISTDPAVDIQPEIIPSGLRVRGAFMGGQSYNLLIKKGLRSIFGRELEDDYSTLVSFADPQPYISFTEHNAIYLSTKGERNLGINIVNVPKVKISVFKIFENNIQHYMRLGKNWEYNYDEETQEYNDYYTWMFDEDYSK